ncbi:MAG: LLM class flavin-dependent oxidoreductase [Acidimicrobiia bacterium]
MARRPISFGLTFDFRNTAPEEKSFVDVYAETLDLIELADEVGIDHVWLSEHHFTEDGHCPSLLPLAGAIAARTKRIRISSYVFLLPLHDPLRVAEDVAVLDVISNGRMELGVGLGYRIEEFEGFGIDRKHRASRMEEACQILLTAWTQDNWTFSGRHHEYRNVSVYPKPVQRPHPKLWISGRNDIAASRAARFRTPLLVAPQPYAIDPEAIYGGYASALREAGEDPSRYEVAGSFNCIVTDDPKAYRAKVRSGSRQRAQTYEKWYSEAGDISDDADRILNPKQTGWSPTVIGDPETCVEALNGYLEHTSVPYTNLIMAVYDATAIEAFARDVMPHFR